MTYFENTSPIELPRSRALVFPTSTHARRNPLGTIATLIFLGIVCPVISFLTALEPEPEQDNDFTF